MLRGYLQKTLTKYLGEYFEGFDKSTLSVAIWKGEVKLTEARLKESVIDKFHTPYSLKFSEIKNLQIKVKSKN